MAKAVPAALVLCVAASAFQTLQPLQRARLNSRRKATKDRSLGAKTDDWTLGDDFALADALPKYTIDYGHERYTLWRALRQSSGRLSAATAAELRERARTGADRGFAYAVEPGLEPEVLHDVVADSSIVSGQVNGANRIWPADKAQIKSLDDEAEFLVDGTRLYEIGSRREENKGLMKGLMTAPLAALLLCLLLWNPITSLFSQPTSSSVYFYSESSTTIMQRRSDGSYETRTKRDVQTNFQDPPQSIVRGSFFDYY